MNLLMLINFANIKKLGWQSEFEQQVEQGT
jgi:hypothetical protein